MQQPSPSAETEALLARLSQRPGVQSTIILDRNTGAIVRSSGLITAEELEQEGGAATSTTTTGNQTAYSNGGTDGEGRQIKKGTRNAEDVARIVYTFVKSVGEMVQNMNGEMDEAKLVRIRTKRNEIVVVPDARFLAVVVHDTPAA
jgi:dynein light chain roadblock-type